MSSGSYQLLRPFPSRPRVPGLCPWVQAAPKAQWPAHRPCFRDISSLAHPNETFKPLQDIHPAWLFNYTTILQVLKFLDDNVRQFWYLWLSIFCDKLCCIPSDRVRSDQLQVGSESAFPSPLSPPVSLAASCCFCFRTYERKTSILHFSDEVCDTPLTSIFRHAF